ncbi:MAG: hypothetical protein JF593_04675, partial [Novosphingobium sp.]|nr:hypothetical protein [Novosphingobium sp.]
MRAAAQTGNIDLVVTGAELFAGLLEERWADVHPQLDEYGFIGRKTPCESLTRLVDFLGPLARVPLIEHPRLGRYSGADFDRFHQEGSDAPNFGMFRALLDATPPEELQQIVDRLDALRSAIRRADTVLTINADGDTATNFQPTYELLDKLRRGVAATIPGAPVAVPEVTAVQASGNGGSLSTLAPVANGGESFGGAVNSREDVIRALDAISSYYARHEPASPVPFALRRARDWISLDFLAVLEDIAPGGLDEAKRVLTSGRNTNAAASSEWSDSAPSSTTSDGW